MNEIVDFRIPEKYAAACLPKDVGDLLGASVRRVLVRAGSPLFLEIGELQRRFRERGEVFFYGWSICREYTTSELRTAELMTIRCERTIEPPGEECGTVYDDSRACPGCGSGAPQVSELRLDLAHAPAKLDAIRTIAGEIILSQRFAEFLSDEKVCGVELSEVRRKDRSEPEDVDLNQVPAGRELLRLAREAGAPHPTWEFWVWVNRMSNQHLLDTARREYSMLRRLKLAARQTHIPSWFQPHVTAAQVEIAPPTRAGSDPYDDGSYGACRLGDLLGLNLLTEVTIARSSWDGSDVVFSRQHVGVRRGLLRPRPVLFVSPKIWRGFEAAGIRGLTVEVAHLV